MGVVYRAEDTRLGRTVALKFLRTPIADADDTRKQLEREAKHAATLLHPNIAAIFEFDEIEDPHTHSKREFIAMEYVKGETLNVLLEQGPLAQDRIHSIVTSLARGLLAAHNQGLVHSDVKPSNICITSDGSVKILDFGLARLRGLGGRTSSNLLQGTPSYMAPEQITGGNVDQQADIWSFGVVLYQLLTGRHPFRGDYPSAVMFSILNEDAPRVESLRRDVSEPLRLLCERCLEKEPSRRIKSMEEVLKILGEEPSAMGSGLAAKMLERQWNRALTGGAIVLALVGMWYAIEHWLLAPPADHKTWRVAVLPFQNASNSKDAEEWPILVQALFVRELTGVENLGILDPVSLNDKLRRALGTLNASRTSSFFGSLVQSDIGYVVDGTILRRGEQFVLALNVIDPAKNEVRYSQQKEFGNEANLPTAVGSLTEDLLNFFRVQVLQVGKDKDLRPWTQQRRHNIAAVRAFTQASELIYNGEPGAEKFLRQAIELDSAFISARVWLVSVLATRGEIPEARKHYEELVKQESKASPFEQAMIGWASSFIGGDVRSQARFLKLALEFSPGSNILAYNLARVFSILKEPQHAAEALRPAIEAHWQFPPAHYLYAISFYDRGLKNEAREALENSLSIKPVYPLTYGLLSILYLRAQDTAKATQFEKLAFEQSGLFQRDLSRTYGMMGYFSLAESLYSKAILYYGMALSLSSNNIRYIGERGKAYFGERKLESAKKDLEKVLALDSTWSDAYSILGTIFEEENDTSRALFHYRSYLVRDSTSENAQRIKRRILALTH